MTTPTPSPTPRSDAQHLHAFGDSEWVKLEFAMQLERELTQWRFMATRLGEVIAKSSFDLIEDEAAALAELKELRDKP